MLWPCSPISEPQRVSVPVPLPLWLPHLLPTLTGLLDPHHPPASRGSGQLLSFLLTPLLASRQPLSSPWRQRDENKLLLALRQCRMRNDAIQRSICKVDKALKDWETWVMKTEHVFSFKRQNRKRRWVVVVFFFVFYSSDLLDEMCTQIWPQGAQVCMGLLVYLSSLTEELSHQTVVPSPNLAVFALKRLSF